MKLSTLRAGLFAVLFAASGAYAAQTLQIESISYAPEATVAGEALTLNGAGLRKKLFFKVYAAGLYTRAPAKDGAAVMAETGAARVRLGLLRDVSGESFISALDDGLKANLTPESEKAVAKELDELRTLMKKIGDVKVNDLVDFDFDPAKGTVVSLNGQPVGAAIGGGRALYNAVLAIWLGQKAIDDTLKAGMLGK
ncbi:MAG: chalcone isomerase family protein [Sutterella sp.]|nr:chalcone isomerase family protein [Sutterella sp.]